MSVYVYELPKVIVFIHMKKNVFIKKEEWKKKLNTLNLVENVKQHFTKKRRARTLYKTQIPSATLAAACMHSSTKCVFFFSLHLLFLFSLIWFVFCFWWIFRAYKCVSEPTVWAWCVCMCWCGFFSTYCFCCLVRQRFLTSLLVRLVRFSWHMCKLWLLLLLFPWPLLSFFFLYTYLRICFF